MAIIKITLNGEHIQLIKWLRFGKIDVKHEKSELRLPIARIGNAVDSIDDEAVKSQVFENLGKVSEACRKDTILLDEDKDKYYGIDTYDPFGGGNAIEDAAYILGLHDKLIEGTETLYGGPKFPKDVTEHIITLLEFIGDNLTCIEELIHQRCSCGGIEPMVTYYSYDNEHIWYTKDEFDEMRKKRKR